MKIGNNFAFNSYYKNRETIDGMYELENATVEGVGNKTLLLLTITLMTSMLFIGITLRMGINLFAYILSGIFTFVLQIIMCFSPLKAKKLAIPYAISEGLVIGSICGLTELVLPGMGLQISGIALLATLSVFVGAIIVYRKGIIKVNSRFRRFLFSFMIGALIFSAVFGVLCLIAFFTTGVDLWSMFYFSGFGLVGAIVMCVLASLYVIASLGTADQLISSGASKEYEWYAAYAITLNVIYLFLEIFRLILIIVQRSSKN